MSLSESELYAAYRGVSKISDARNAVLARDRFHCIARDVDPDAGPCYDAFGFWFSGFDATGVCLEVDRIPPAPGSRLASHSKPETMLSLCPGHHRGTGPNRGYVWATSHRAELREFLAKVAA